METSDSDCFESADEEFYSDEDTVVKTLKKSEEQFSNLNVNKDDKHVEVAQIGSDTRIESVESVCVDKKGVNDNKVENNSNVILTRLANSKGTLESKDTVLDTVKKFGGKELIEKSVNNASNANDGWEIDDDLSNDESLWKNDEITWDIQNNLPPKSNIETTIHDKGENNYENIHKNNCNLTAQSSPPPVGVNEDSPDNKDDGWGNWGNWEVSSILTTATQGVSTLKNHVSQGFSTVLETGMGIPDPKELAQLHHTQETLRKTSNVDVDIQKTNTNNSGSGGGTGFGFTNLVSGVTKFVETTSTKVISGGLDTLETIGKKTMQVLQEGDPGLKRKRSFLKLQPKKPILSQILREAKEKAEQDNTVIQESHLRKDNYEKLFDDHHGLVHLEALEMLSKQCEIRLEMLSATRDENSLIEIQETLDQVKELCELPDEDDEQPTLKDIKESLKVAVEELHINITYEKLVSTWEETELWLKTMKLNVCDETELHQQAILTLAQLTALAVEQYHKAGELLLIKEHRSTADEADSLVQITTILTSLIGLVAAKFTDKLNTEKPVAENKFVNGLITNVFLEAANSSSYIQDAFQLLIPVLQAGAV